MNEITITIKLTPEALEDAADKLFKMAYGLSNGGEKLKVDTEIVSGKPIESGEPFHIVSPDNNRAQELFGHQPADIPKVPTADIPKVPTADIPKVPTADIPEPKKNLEGVELDSTGLPWDARINSESKAKLKTGVWRLRRNIDKTLVPVVLAELRAAMNATGGTVPPAPPAPEVPEVPPAPIERSVPDTANPTLSVVPPAPPAPPAPEVPPAMTFPQFLQKVTERSTAKSPSGVDWGKQYTNEIQKIIVSKGFASLPLLMSRPDLIPVVNEEAEVLWQQIVATEVK